MKNMFKKFKTALTLVDSVELIPIQEVNAILNDKKLQKTAKIILGKSINMDYKLRIMFDESLREEAIKNSNFWYEMDTILNSSLSIADKELIMFNGKLRKYIKYFITPKEEALKARNALGLDNISKIANHIILHDPSGKTRGCGCNLCLNKHEEYKNSKVLNSYRKLLTDMSDIEVLFEGDGNKKNPLADPFKCQYFDNMNGAYIKGFIDSSFLKSPFTSRVITLTKTKAPVRKLTGAEGRRIVLTRINRERASLHSKVQTYFGKENKLRTSRNRILELTFLPY